MLRYRIHHDREHRDGLDDMIAPVIVPGAIWYCGACGEDNEDGDVGCWYCRTERGDWMCSEDGHKNPKGADECEECGRERPDPE